MTGTTYVTLLRISSKIIETCVITAAVRGGPRRMSCERYFVFASLQY